MQSIKSVLKNFNPSEDKYISREFQAYGVHLADTLDDYKHKSLYIKLAKTVNRSILEKALSYACDSKVDRKGALFMWKLKQLKDEAKKKGIEIENPVQAKAQKTEGRKNIGKVKKVST